MKKMNRLFVALAVSALAIGAAFAQSSYTSPLGQTFDVGPASVTTFNDLVDQSDYATVSKREGLIVAHWSVPAYGVTTSATITLKGQVPKGAIFSAPAYIDIQTAILPATATNAIFLQNSGDTNVVTILPATAGGSVAVISTNINTLAKAIDNLDVVLTLTGSAPTSGAFTVFIPYFLGNP